MINKGGNYSMIKILVKESLKAIKQVVTQVVSFFSVEDNYSPTIEYSVIRIEGEDCTRIRLFGDLMVPWDRLGEIGRLVGEINKLIEEDS
jgi:hypothetical protein